MKEIVNKPIPLFGVNLPFIQNVTTKSKVETINEVDQIEKIDSRTAAYRIAQELRSYRQLGSLQKSIEQAQQRLALLNMFTAQKRR